MAFFLSSQLDFILFFYGLAFILLGATCWTVARSEGRRGAWAVLGGFGFIHGIGEWLDLAALIIGDGPLFAMVRATMMTASFVLLLDFARLEAIRLGLRLPGRWIYVPLLMFVAFAGLTGGVNVASIVARYAIGFFGAAGASLVLALQAKMFSGGARRFAIAASVGFAFYAVAVGLIVPAGPLWPADLVNYGWFANATGVPIQLVRGLLACWIAFSIWAIWSEQLASEVSSGRYTAYVRGQFTWTVVAMTTILVSGWMLTEFLGGIYRQSMQEQAAGDIELLASRLTGDTATIDGMVKALARSLPVLPLLTGGSHEELDIAQAVLDVDIEAAGAKHGYILNTSGVLLAPSRSAMVQGTNDYGEASYFRTSIAGEAGHAFVFDTVTGSSDYYASQPIRTKEGKIVGVAVLVKSLDTFQSDLRQVDRPYFFIDPDGIVVMTNRPAALFRPMWPLPADRQSYAAHQYSGLNDRPMLDRELVDATWINVEQERNYVRRRFANHTLWSLVILKPTREIFASRFLGIAITLLVTVMALTYFVGRGRWVHDDVQTDNRIRLQELNQDLGVKASIDPLTGIYNRSMLDQTLAAEMARADRYNTPLSLLLYDIDHFKAVNDTFGHPEGDKVLIRLSRFVANLIRATDFFARWGGEEFLILTPGSDGSMALEAAEKLREAISRIVFSEVGTVTCSFGVAQYARGESAAELIARADDALYRAKANGRNQVQLTPQPGTAKPRLVSGEML